MKDEKLCEVLPKGNIVMILTINWWTTVPGICIDLGMKKKMKIQSVLENHYDTSASVLCMKNEKLLLIGFMTMIKSNWCELSLWAKRVGTQ